MANKQSLRHLVADVRNSFCAITLTVLDREPIERSARLLLTTGARVENTGQQWNTTRTVVTTHGGAPSLIEAVSGRIILRNLQGATHILVRPLDGAGRPLGEALSAQHTPEGWAISVGDVVTTWYEIIVKR